MTETDKQAVLVSRKKKNWSLNGQKELVLERRDFEIGTSNMNVHTGLHFRKK